jgi:hypothetical protein
MFHQDADAGERGDRQEDMELLTCAYEKAVAYLSDRDIPRPCIILVNCAARSSDVDGSQSTDLYFTINFNA